MHTDPRSALARLLEAGALTPEIADVDFSGDDSTIASPHRLATGMGVAIAAQAAAVAEIWRLRSGRRQRVAVDLHAAAHALNPASFLKQHGYPVTIRFVFTEPGNGFFQTRDRRYIYMAHGSPRLRNGLLDVLQCANSKPALTRAVAARDAGELEATCQQQRLPLVMVRSAAEWRAHPHGQLLVGRPVIEIERIADGKPMPFAPAGRPLSDIRVLENTHVLAGPGIGRCLAEQGADALRIAPPRTSDPINFMIDTGFGKRSAFLDLDNAGDVARYRELAADCDVVVQSLRPGNLDHRGLGAADLAAASKGLVYVSVSCYGHDGPWSPHVGYDPLAQSATGVCVVEGDADAPRVVPCTLLADYLTAYLGAFGALAALIRRAREGGSYHVRISLAQTCMWVQNLGLRDPGASKQAGSGSAPRILRMDSPFGDLRYLAPVAQYGETAAFWDKPPVPLGASPAEWLVRAPLGA